MSSVKTSLAWSFSERYMSSVVMLVNSMILARLLTPEQIGIYSLCAALTTMATIFRDFGVSEYIIQEKELNDEKLGGAYALAIITAWSMAIVLYFVRNPVAEFYHEPGVAEIIQVLCLTFLILPFSSPAFALLNRRMEFNKILLVQFPGSVVQAITATTLAYNGFSYMSLAWASLANIFCQALIVTFMRPKESFILPRFRKAGDVFKFGTMMSSSRLVEVIRNDSHEFFISHFFGFSQLGIFSRAQGLIKLFYTNVTSAIARVASPSLASSFRLSKKKFKQDYLNGISFFLAVAWPFFLFISFESKWIIYILFGDQWLAAAPIASILAIASFISSMNVFSPSALIAMGKVKLRMMISFIVLPVQLIGVLIAVHFSLQATACIWIVSSSVALLLYYYFILKNIESNPLELINGIKKCIGITLSLMALEIIMRFLINELTHDSLMYFILRAVVYSLFWFFIVSFIQHPLSIELKKLIKKVLSIKRTQQPVTKR